MKATEVTQAEWLMEMGDIRGFGPNYPVEEVSWDEAVLYANALSRREGLPECYAGSTFRGLTCTGYRLPTEAEWEYAARAGTTGPTYGPNDTIGWHNDNSDGRTHAVGGKTANSFGLYDMSGNVSEWTGDRDGPDPGTVTDATMPWLGSERVVCGGSWGGHAGTAVRRTLYQFSRDPFTGFRLVRAPLVALTSTAPTSAAPSAGASSGATAGCPAGYVRIAPRIFTMGSPDEEDQGWGDETPDGEPFVEPVNETPQHSVIITRGYCMKATEVTQGEWQAVMGSNPSKFKDCGANCPVEQVSWDDAVGYANTLSRREGLPECYAGSTFTGLGCRGYRLPTEAEWEYAARAGTLTPPYGPIDPPYGPIDTRNRFGLYDMLGNVSEWTGDWHGPYPGTVTDPTGPATGFERVVRGGDFAFRSGYPPGVRGRYLGFRLVRTMP
jgi:sulfatase modifying factor 1